MKRVLFFFAMVVSGVSISFSQEVRLNAVYAMPTFLTSGSEPYVEIQFLFDANSLTLGRDGQQQPYVAVNLQTVISDQSGKVQYADKRSIKQMLGTNSDFRSQATSQSFLNVQRVALANGFYEVSFTIEDAVSAAMGKKVSPVVVRDELSINYSKQEVSVSDVQLLERYVKSGKENILSKNGYDLYPGVIEVLPPKTSELKYYAEIYNSDASFSEDNEFIVDIHVETANQNRRISALQSKKKQKPKPVEIVLGTMDISLLPSGGYYLVVEARSKSNILHAYKKALFIVENDSIDRLYRQQLSATLPQSHWTSEMTDSLLNFYIPYLQPIASEYERSFVLKGYKDASLEARRIFFYRFWQQRNPDHPEQGWKEYLKRINYVHDHYSTRIKEGYQNDMGRVYLVYGPPTKIIDEKFKGVSGFYRGSPDILKDVEIGNQSGAESVNYLPYQIWRYDNTPFFERNRSFVFYAPQMDLKDYRLLHSNARGEVNDPYWERVLSRNLLPEDIEGAAGRQFRRGY